jgi:hypothetical protein
VTFFSISALMTSVPEPATPAPPGCANADAVDSHTRLPAWLAAASAPFVVGRGEEVGLLRRLWEQCKRVSGTRCW